MESPTQLRLRPVVLAGMAVRVAAEMPQDLPVQYRLRLDRVGSSDRYRNRRVRRVGRYRKRQRRLGKRVGHFEFCKWWPGIRDSNRRSRRLRHADPFWSSYPRRRWRMGQRKRQRNEWGTCGCHGNRRHCSGLWRLWEAQLTLTPVRMGGSAVATATGRRWWCWGSNLWRLWRLS